MSSYGASFIRPTPKLTKLGLRNKASKWTGQTRPRKASSNGPIAGSLASQQSAKSSARLSTRRSVDTARGAQNCTCVPVRGRSTRSCSHAARAVVRRTELRRNHSQNRRVLLGCRAYVKHRNNSRGKPSKTNDPRQP